jgi:hypothetical protein
MQPRVYIESFHKETLQKKPQIASCKWHQYTYITWESIALTPNNLTRHELKSIRIPVPYQRDPTTWPPMLHQETTNSANNNFTFHLCLILTNKYIQFAQMNNNFGGYHLYAVRSLFLLSPFSKPLRFLAF